MKRVEIPGHAPLELAHLVLEAKGTLTNRGTLVEGVPARIEALSRELEIHLLSAETLGTLAEVARSVRARAEVVRDDGARPRGDASALAGRGRNPPRAPETSGGPSGLLEHKDEAA